MKKSTRKASAKLRGTGGLYQRGPIWWVHYSFEGKAYRESSRSTERADAETLLKEKLGKVLSGQFQGPEAKRTTFDDLVSLVEQDYERNQRKSSDRMQRAVKALRQTFGFSYAKQITFKHLDDYATERQRDGIANATIRYELAMLRKAFRLAKKRGMVATTPEFPSLTVNNARTGFFELDDFAAVRANLPAHLQPVVTFAYLTGWRIRSEILPLQWQQVDFKAGTVRLDPGSTKNGEGRMVPFAALPELADLLRQQWERTKALRARAENLTPIPWVFHRNGKPIKDFRGAWHNACLAAKVPERIPHDFRRTAVRNLERAGASRSAAMKITGHKTESVYRRYAIVSEADLSEALRKLGRLHEHDAAVSDEQSRTCTKVSQLLDQQGRRVP